MIKEWRGKPRPTAFLCVLCGLKIRRVVRRIAAYNLIKMSASISQHNFSVCGAHPTLSIIFRCAVHTLAMIKEWRGKPRPTIYLMGQAENSIEISKIKVKI